MNQRITSYFETRTLLLFYFFYHHSWSAHPGWVLPPRNQLKNPKNEKRTTHCNYFFIQSDLRNSAISSYFTVFSSAFQLHRQNRHPWLRFFLRPNKYRYSSGGVNITSCLLSSVDGQTPFAQMRMELLAISGFDAYQYARLNASHTTNSCNRWAALRPGNYLGCLSWLPILIIGRLG